MKNSESKAILSLANSHTDSNANQMMKKSKSKDSLGYKDIHGSARIIKAFKNSQRDDLIMEYFKNKSQLERQYKRAISKN
jgi:hypothetical protein